MTPEHAQRVRQIAAAAREYDPARREMFVHNAAAGDAALESDALALLRENIETTPYPASAPTATLAPGILLKDRYLIIRELNRGGFGVVYIAHDQQLHGKPVVVKLQLQTLGDDPWFERKFGEEIRALALIDHPGVVGALDSGKTPGGQPFLVMQYVEGRSLRSAMNPEGMPLDRVANIIRQTGQALSAAHDKRVWHRDLKPENIMLQTLPGGDEHVRLIDFGIATIVDLEQSQRRAATRVAGSLGYMAPEQIDGQPSASTDVYAFGVIAYEMITGRKPFLPEDALQLVALQRAGVRIKPSDLRPGLPVAAQKIVLQALAYNPKERPASAREFGEQLAQALLGDPSTSSSGIHARARARRRMMTGIGAAVVVVAIGAGIWWLRSGSHAAIPIPSQGSPAPAQSQVDNLAVELAFWKSINDANRPELYREYLAKYPHGQFVTLARMKLDELNRPLPPRQDVAVVAPKKTPAIKLPAPRPSLNADEYYGPLRGQLQWSGRLADQTALTIQAGRSDSGSLSGDLPRVPVTIEAPAGIAVNEGPSEHNKWDRIVLRNNTGKDVETIAIRWKIAK